MINAFLVFNGSGQPRLTKFYTQLVSPPLAHRGHHRQCHNRERLTPRRTQPCSSA
ncbi:hypothetical protein IMZ48_34135 [Candidatus Bathyarchaeota archaeon]|nr:hypothetical protein [Candidatus Bathyarchaeota archaeon]